MDKSTLNKFQTLFEQERARLLYSSRIISDAFEIQKEDLPDEADWSASELEQAMKTRLRSRETSFLKKIDTAFEKEHLECAKAVRRRSTSNAWKHDRRRRFVFGAKKHKSGMSGILGNEFDLHKIVGSLKVQE